MDMKSIVLRSPGGLDRLELIDMPDPGAPGPGEIRVRLRASWFCQISRHRLWRARAGSTIWPALMAGWMGCGA